ncbi:MAG: transglutaminase family protein, partial [Ferruginibacter sp.]|nr:transglutaminase family protein [Rhodoferax sp.]
MYIKIGFDIALAIATPMALIHLLHVHPSRRGDLLAPQFVEVLPGLAVEEYFDAFGNLCSRVNAPLGATQVGFRSEAIVRDSGLP